MSARWMLAALLLLPATAIADSKEDPNNEITRWAVGLDVASASYPDQTWMDNAMQMHSGTLTQRTYALAMRMLVWDGKKKTPLGHTPGLWIDMQIGYIGKASGDGFNTDSTSAGGGGGPLWSPRLSGPWQLYRSDTAAFGMGLGTQFGIQVGVPKAAGRLANAFALDAELMAIAELKLGGLRTLFEGDYAIGTGYNEERVYGRLMLGGWALGAAVTIGQSTTDYFQLGLNLGRAWTKVR